MENYNQAYTTQYVAFANQQHRDQMTYNHMFFEMYILQLNYIEVDTSHLREPDQDYDFIFTT